MSGGRSSREKGMRAERQIVELLRAFGFDARRVPLSGSVTGFESDVHLTIGNKTFTIESKVRGKGFGLLYRWLTGVDMLIVKSDYKSLLAILPVEKLANLLANSTAQTAASPTNQSENQAPDSLPIKHSPQPIYRP
jgi:hypothetical protein